MPKSSFFSRGIILAAGKGERMFPLTSSLPKPLLPFAGVEVISYAARALLQAGVSSPLLVNVHHLGEQVIAFGQDNPFGFEFEIADEREELLGTGGALGAIYSRFSQAGSKKDTRFLVMNGDIITDFPLASLVAFHEAQGAIATMALLPFAHPREQKVWCYHGRVLAIGGEEAPCEGASPHGFACAHVLSHDFLALLPEKKIYGIMEVYRQALRSGALIAGYAHPAFWYDIGTPAGYLSAHRALLNCWEESPFSSRFDPLGVFSLQQQAGRKMHFVPARAGGPSLIAEEHLARKDIKLGPFVVINPDCEIAPGTSLEETVVLGHSKIAAGSTIVRGIVAPNAIITT